MPNRGLSHLDPWTQPGSNAGTYLTGGVYDQLVDYDYTPDHDAWFNGKIVGELAESWERLDPQSYVFHVRHGVKWHDGEPLTAEDVRWSYEFVRDPANKLTPSVSLRSVDSIDTPDPYTVHIYLKEPNVDFLGQLVNAGRLAILPKHVYDRGDSFQKVAIGTGPFRVESFQPDNSVTYVANREYWRPGRPYLDRFKITGPADEAARTAAFFAGQNDVLKVAAKPQADAVAAQVRDARITTFYQENNVEMWLRLGRAPFSDLRVRQAVHLAVDRQAMLNTLTGGDGLMNPPGINAIYRSWAIQPAELQAIPGWRTPKTDDQAQARRLLSDAGYRDGLSFTIKVDRSNPNWPAVAEMISAQLRSIGVDAKLQPLESGVAAKAWLDGDYEAVVESKASERDWASRLHSRGVENTMPVHDPELDRLIEAQSREFDEAKRAQLIKQLQQVLLHQVYTVPTITYPGYMLEQSWVHGFVDNGGALPNNNDWGQLWIDGSRAPAGR